MTMTGAVAERALRDQALAEAAALFARHGEAASDVLTAQIHDPANSVDERRRHRLARTEVERLARLRRDESNPQALVIWRPSPFSWAGLKAMLGFGTKRGSRRRR